jgi:hypothetical protein
LLAARTRLEEIYEVHNPSELDRIDEILEEYAHAPQELVAAAERMYTVPQQQQQMRQESLAKQTFEGGKAGEGKIAAAGPDGKGGDKGVPTLNQLVLMPRQLPYLASWRQQTR